MLLSEPQMTNTVHARDSYRPMRLARLGFFVRIRAFLRKLPVAQHPAPQHGSLLPLRLVRGYNDRRQDQDVPHTDIAMEDIALFESIAVGCNGHLHECDVLWNEAVDRLTVDTVPKQSHQLLAVGEC